MNRHSTYNRTTRILSLAASIIILVSAVWLGASFVSAGVARGAFPTELASHLSTVSALPEVESTANAEARALYSQLADEFYSPLNQPETSRTFAAAPNTGNNVAEISQELAQPKVQCNIRTSASSLDNLNGVAMNARECL